MTGKKKLIFRASEEEQEQQQFNGYEFVDNGFVGEWYSNMNISYQKPM